MIVWETDVWEDVVLWQNTQKGMHRGMLRFRNLFLMPTKEPVRTGQDCRNWGSNHLSSKVGTQLKWNKTRKPSGHKVRTSQQPTSWKRHHWILEHALLVSTPPRDRISFEKKKEEREVMSNGYVIQDKRCRLWIRESWCPVLSLSSLSFSYFWQ